MSSSFISAVFDTRARADSAIEALAREGFGPDDVSVVSNEAHPLVPPRGPVGAPSGPVGAVAAAPTGPRVGHEPAAVADVADGDAVDPNQALVEGAAMGATGGLATGAVAAGIVGLASAALPGLGLFAAGPILAALIGAGIGGAAGGVVGTLMGLGTSEAEAALADERLREGGVLVGVHATNDRRNLALEVLQRAGGESFKNA